MKAGTEPMENGLKGYPTDRLLKIKGVVIPIGRGHHPNSPRLVAPLIEIYFNYIYPINNLLSFVFLSLLSPASLHIMEASFPTLY